MALDFTRISYVESNDALTKSPEGCYGSKSHRGDLIVLIKVMTITAKNRLVTNLVCDGRSRGVSSTNRVLSKNNLVQQSPIRKVFISLQTCYVLIN